ncbi:MAG: glycerol kinase GlpK [Eubacterium sp.]|nr:glycerol kinase GlpK [Eubacterium sp.]
MNQRYIISIDQSTQGTKALLLDYEKELRILTRADRPHEQLVNEKGWVSHNPEEIYENVVGVVKDLMEKAFVLPEQVAALAISNQRETSLIWDSRTGKPLADAVVWQCSRAADICGRDYIADKADIIAAKTGIPLSPYFPAAKLCWLLENTPDAVTLMKEGFLRMGTVDTWLVYRLTQGREYRTDYSNASRTQLFNIHTLQWDEEICGLFGIDPACLPAVTDSDACFGITSCGGLLPQGVPIAAVLGDSHAALFGQNCEAPGQTKVTYGTGSSIMMNVGSTPSASTKGLASSIGWVRSGRPVYVLEGNLNYTGAVITWLTKDLKIADNAWETSPLAEEALQDDDVYFVPAFSGLGAPYWDSHAKAAISGMDRTTGRNELVRAALESIAYQSGDVISAMEEDSGVRIREIRVDGGPVANRFLMQFTADILDCAVSIPEAEELSAMGVGLLAGITLKVLPEDIRETFIRRRNITPSMADGMRRKKLSGWKKAVESVLSR